MKEINPYNCPKCKKNDYIAMSPLESYCCTCKGYFNRTMNVVYKKRISWDKLLEMWENIKETK
jgi:hypothetical protein